MVDSCKFEDPITLWQLLANYSISNTSTHPLTHFCFPTVLLVYDEDSQAVLDVRQTIIERFPGLVIEDLVTPIGRDIIDHSLEPVKRAAAVIFFYKHGGSLLTKAAAHQGLMKILDTGNREKFIVVTSPEYDGNRLPDELRIGVQMKSFDKMQLTYYLGENADQNT